MKTIIYGALAASTLVILQIVTLPRTEKASRQSYGEAYSWDNYAYPDTPQYDFTDSYVEYTRH